MPLLPHQFWQVLDEPGTHGSEADGWVDSYPASLPGDGSSAVASLIINQASFAVEDAIAAAMTDLLEAYHPEVIVGVPTLGLPLAGNVARRLGHERMVALGTSRKFWYRDELSAPMSSITSPTHQKTIYLDPRSLPLLEGKRVAVVDDVISSGTSMRAVLKLLTSAGFFPTVIAAAMLQGERWRDALDEHQIPIVAPLESPRLGKTAQGRWQPS